MKTIVSSLYSSAEIRHWLDDELNGDFEWVCKQGFLESLTECDETNETRALRIWLYKAPWEYIDTKDFSLEHWSSQHKDLLQIRNETHLQKEISFINFGRMPSGWLRSFVQKKKPRSGSPTSSNNVQWASAIAITDPTAIGIYDELEKLAWLPRGRRESIIELGLNQLELTRSFPVPMLPHVGASLGPGEVVSQTRVPTDNERDAVRCSKLEPLLALAIDELHRTQEALEVSRQNTKDLAVQRAVEAKKHRFELDVITSKCKHLANQLDQARNESLVIRKKISDDSESNRIKLEKLETERNSSRVALEQLHCTQETLELILGRLRVYESTLACSTELLRKAQLALIISRSQN